MTQKIHSAARGLASLGRNGDSTLVHMSPREVQGLQNLAKRHGTNLTINPKTGLPEAFSLEKLLPTLGGLALGVVAPELVIPAAVAAGGIKKAEGGSWTDAISTGLQVYGGGSLGSGLAAAGAPAAEASAGQAATSAGGVGTAEGATSTADALSAQAANAPTVTQDLATQATTPEALTDVQNLQNVAGPQDLATGPEGFQDIQNLNAKVLPDSSFANAAPTPYDASSMANRLSAAGEGASSLKGWGSALGDTNMAGKFGLMSGVMAAAKEEPKKPEEHKPVYYIPKEGGPALYEPGKVNPNIAKLGYIPTGEQAFTGQKFNEGVYSYSPTKYEPVEGMRRGGLASLAKYDGGGAVPQSTGQQILANSQPPQQAQQMQQQQPTQGQMATQDMNQYFANQMAASSAPPSALNAPSNQPNAAADWMAGFNESLRPAPQPEDTAADQQGDKVQDALSSYQAKMEAEAQRKGAYIPGQTMLDRLKGGMAAGGLAHLSNTYAAGGKLLRGAGDGMSDSIPAVIGGEKPQRAALADGEFVVPADVVSHLGNGSTEAGSRKLYNMMDKIRKARTGRKKQAPAVKADRFMPK